MISDTLKVEQSKELKRKLEVKITPVFVEFDMHSDSNLKPSIDFCLTRLFQYDLMLSVRKNIELFLEATGFFIDGIPESSFSLFLDDYDLETMQDLESLLIPRTHIRFAQKTEIEEHEPSE